MITAPAAGRLRPRWRAVRTQWWLLLTALLATLGALQATNLLWRIDFAIHDAAMRGGPAPDDVLVVAIDDASIAALGRWPWPRAVHAALLERLRAAGAKAVALDVIFTEPEATGAGDAALAAALARGPPTVLPLLATREWPAPAGPGGDAPPASDATLREQLPIEPLASGAAALGHAHVEIDRDGIARSIYLREGRGRPAHPHFMLALLERVAPAQLAPLRGERHPDLAGAAADAWVRDFRIMIPFLGPPGHFATVSYADVLAGRVDPARLRDRWVLVGATAQGLGDAYATPLSRDGRTTSGVEFSANVLQALRAGSGIVPAGPVARFALGALPLLVAFAGFLWLSPRRSLLLLVALWVATLAASALALQGAAWWWPPAASLAVLTAAYPLWNWRRLEATQRFLDEELTRLVAERTPLAREPATALATPAAAGDPLQRRIDLVEAATARVRDLQRLLADTVASLPDAALVADRDARVVLANPAAARLLGAPAAEALLDAPLGPLCESAFGADGVDLATRLVEAPLTVEVRTRGDRPACDAAAPPERPRDLLVRAAPFRDADGRRIGTIVSFADVTGLRDMQRERDALVGFLSHDIRSPITSLLALTQLQRDPRRALAPPQFAERAAALAQRSLELAEGFVALARAETVERSAFEPFDLRDAVQDALDETWAAAQLRGIALRFVPAAAGWPVNGHRSLLARAVANLVGNAVKFAPAGTAVSVAGRRVGAEWEIRVTDAGPGIAPALRERLFIRFQRGQPAAADPGGSGLGLAFVRVVATRHGGSVGVREPQGDRALAASGPGTGTGAGMPGDAGPGSEFFLRIPALDPPPAGS